MAPANSPEVLEEPVDERVLDFIHSLKSRAERPTTGTDEWVEEYVRCHSPEIAIATIGAVFGVTEQHAKQILETAGGKVQEKPRRQERRSAVRTPPSNRPTEVTDEWVDEFIQHHPLGANLDVIGDVFGVSKQMVRLILLSAIAKVQKELSWRGIRCCNDALPTPFFNHDQA